MLPAWTDMPTDACMDMPPACLIAHTHTLCVFCVNRNTICKVHAKLIKPAVCMLQPGQPEATRILIFTITDANQSNQDNQNLDIRDNIRKPEQPR